MTQISKTRIVNETQFLTRQDILDLKLNETFMNSLFNDKYSAVIWLARLQLIKNEQYCIRCESRLLNLTKKNKSLDGVLWVCKRPCTYSVSIRNNSFFQYCRLNFSVLIKLFYKYLCGVSFVDISYDLNIDRNTCGEWSSLVREAVGEFLCEESEMLGGLNPDGSAKVVEMDESLFFRAKYNRGRITHGQWYVAAIERGTRKIFMMPVPNRNAATIGAIIRDNILPGTIVITDQWRAYARAFSDLGGFQHLTINHSLHFVDPENPETHTQNVEGLWSRSKFFLRKRLGISQELHNSYLLQFMWEYRIEKRKRLNVLLFQLSIR